MHGVGAMRSRTALLAAAVAVILSQPARAADDPSSGAWAERVQVIYEPATRTVMRKRLRVWNPDPRKNLDFVWEPDSGAVLAADGTVSGSGKLTWRVRGSASYDPRTVYSTYTGAMREGRRNGKGRLELRGGEVFEGTFVDGLLSGQGVHVDAAGNRYEGEFRAGKPNGIGRLAVTTGEIYTGPFVDGLKHGTGETRLTGGSAYVSQWTRGKEAGRPALLADPTIGGLLKAQSGGGDAGKVDISVALEPRLTQEALDMDGVAYQSMVRDEDVAIFPLDEQLNNLWNGTGTIDANSGFVFEDRDWEYVPAFVEVDLGTKDGSKVKLDRMQLRVDSSDAYRKPMLSLIEHVGCVGFRPAFSVKNFGWGEVRNLTVNMHFSGAQDGGPTSRTFTRSVGSFDEGADIAIRDVFEEAGADTAALENERFSCPTSAGLNVCKSQVMNSVRLGEVADFIWTSAEQYAMPEGGEEAYEMPADGQYFTAATGTFDYDWADDQGNLYHATEPFRANIPVFYIDVQMQAECGAGFGGSPEAGRFQDVRFKVGESNYAVDMPVRGNKNISSYTGRLKLQAEPAMSSIHRFSVAASFADGSVKTSKPVTFFFLKPRMPNFTPGLQPSAASCYMPQGVTGCSELDPRGYEDMPEDGEMPAEGEGQ